MCEHACAYLLCTACATLQPPSNTHKIQATHLSYHIIHTCAVLQGSNMSAAARGQSGSADFNPLTPEGTYALTLSSTIDRAVALQVRPLGFSILCSSSVFYLWIPGSEFWVLGSRGGWGACGPPLPAPPQQCPGLRPAPCSTLLGTPCLPRLGVQVPGPGCSPPLLLPPLPLRARAAVPVRPGLHARLPHVQHPPGWLELQELHGDEVAGAVSLGWLCAPAWGVWLCRWQGRLSWLEQVRETRRLAAGRGVVRSPLWWIVVD